MPERPSDFTITNEDLVHSEDSRRAMLERMSRDVVETAIDLEKNLWVKLGVPLREQNGTYAIYVPDEPYVFTIDDLRLQDPRHQAGVVLRGARTIFAHGLRDGQNVWRFQNGQSVVETVTAYDEYARAHGLPPVDFVFACNPDNVVTDLDVQVSDFDLKAKPVVQAVGGSFSLAESRIDSNGKIFMFAYGQSINFMGLDEMVEHKRLQGQIRLHG